MLRYNGKHRRNHEKNVPCLIIVDLTNTNETWTCTSVDSDDMFNYQCILMDHGLLYMNFSDAIAEGDGDRIMRCWKYLLLHFYSDKDSTKYSLEALYLQLQQQALLSPRQAYRQRWNRGVNNRGVRRKNVSLDLDVEHDNRAVKEAIRKLGPNVTNTSVTRCALMLPIARQTVDAIARECNLVKKSGIHFVNTSNKDMVKMVDELIKADALTETPTRNYKHYKQFARSPLMTIRMSKFCHWIYKHKHELQIQRKAR